MSNSLNLSTGILRQLLQKKYNAGTITLQIVHPYHTKAMVSDGKEMYNVMMQLQPGSLIPNTVFSCSEWRVAQTAKINILFLEFVFNLYFFFV